MKQAPYIIGFLWCLISFSLAYANNNVFQYMLEYERQKLLESMAPPPENNPNVLCGNYPNIQTKTQIKDDFHAKDIFIVPSRINPNSFDIFFSLQNRSTEQDLLKNISSSIPGSIRRVFLRENEEIITPFHPITMNVGSALSLMGRQAYLRLDSTDISSAMESSLSLTFDFERAGKLSFTAYFIQPEIHAAYLDSIGKEECRLPPPEIMDKVLSQ